ncbi:hypothetical protein T265_14196, partial [Opisthorchis viverrini]
QDETSAGNITARRITNVLCQGSLDQITSFTSYVRIKTYCDISNIEPTETRGSLVQHIKLPGNITNQRLSWVPGNRMCCTRSSHASVATIFEKSQFMYNRNALNKRFLGILRQHTTVSALLRAHQ